MKKNIFTIAALTLIIMLTGCTSEITLELKKDGQVDISFSGSAGTAFATLINAAAGNSTAADKSSASSVIFDTKEIEYEMSSNGFTKVKAASKNGSDLTVSMTDKNRKSALFTSGVASVKDGRLTAVLSPQNLVKFYKTADSQTVMFLDMLLAPIFNDEKMSEEEYLEVLASFYGEEIADEMKKSNFRITLKNPDGTQTIKSISFVKLLTLDEVIYLR